MHFMFTWAGKRIPLGNKILCGLNCSFRSFCKKTVKLNPQEINEYQPTTELNMCETLLT